MERLRRPGGGRRSAPVSADSVRGAGNARVVDCHRPDRVRSPRVRGLRRSRLDGASGRLKAHERLCPTWQSHRPELVSKRQGAGRGSRGRGAICAVRAQGNLVSPPRWRRSRGSGMVTPWRCHHLRPPAGRGGLGPLHDSSERTRASASHAVARSGTRAGLVSRRSENRLPTPGTKRRLVGVRHAGRRLGRAPADCWNDGAQRRTAGLVARWAQHRVRRRDPPRQQNRGCSAWRRQRTPAHQRSEAGGDRPRLVAQRAADRLLRQASFGVNARGQPLRPSA